MIYSARKIKTTLDSNINEVISHPDLYCVNPGKDFTRHRKISMKTTIQSLLTIGGKSLKKELLNAYKFSSALPSASAFVQQRSKLLPTAFETIFHNFTQTAVIPRASFKGLRPVAVDGSDLHVPTNKDETDAFFPGENGQKPYNLMHLNALYDLTQDLYLDADIQNARQQSEHRAFTALADRYECAVPTVFIADRGYESYNNMAHIQEIKQFFLIRIKDVGNGGITSGLSLPEKDEFDESFDLNITRSSGNKIKKFKNVRPISSKTAFDFLPTSCPKNAPPVCYTLHIRVVRFKLSDSTYETIATNLSPDDYPPESLKQLYALRWGIEVSFRSLKYSLSLNAFHAKKPQSILQEIFAKLIMFNFTSLVMMSFEALIQDRLRARPKPKKYPYQVDFSSAVLICYQFLLKRMSPNVVFELILKHLNPIRPSKTNPRRKSRKHAISFLYRMP